MAEATTNTLMIAFSRRIEENTLEFRFGGAGFPRVDITEATMNPDASPITTYSYDSSGIQVLGLQMFEHINAGYEVGWLRSTIKARYRGIKVSDVELGVERAPQILLATTVIQNALRSKAPCQSPDYVHIPPASRAIGSALGHGVRHLALNSHWRAGGFPRKRCW